MDNNGGITLKINDPLSSSASGIPQVLVGKERRAKAVRAAGSSIS